MFLVKWFWSTLESFGLVNKHAKILFLGLDNAGKTTLLRILRDDRVVQHAPTRNPTSEELTMGTVTFNAYDLGGHKEARRIWSDYFTSVDGIVYLVDSSDVSRLEETKRELDTLLIAPELENVPMVILGNKVDVHGALSEAQLVDALGVHTQITGKNDTPTLPGTRPLELYMCSIVERQGYREAFLWLSRHLN